jgi:hypothetical protein
MPKMASPEYCVNSGEIADLAIQFQDVSKQIADLETQKDKIKKDISVKAAALREEQALKDNFIGLLRVTGEEAPMRTEFRIKGLALDTDEDFSDFQGSEHQLFEKKKALYKKKRNEVLVKDAEQLIEDIKAAGLDLNSIIDIKVTNEDALLGLNSEAIEKVEAYVPADGFLQKMNDLAPRLTKKAKDFVRECLKDTMSVAVVSGTRGKK